MRQSSRSRLYFLLPLCIFCCLGFASDSRAYLGISDGNPNSWCWCGRSPVLVLDSLDLPWFGRRSDFWGLFCRWTIRSWSCSPCIESKMFSLRGGLIVFSHLGCFTSVRCRTLSVSPFSLLSFANASDRILAIELAFFSWEIYGKKEFFLF